MAQKVAIVTGANCGIGFRAAQMLCQKGIEVILACRNEERGNEAVNQIKKAQADAVAQCMQLDLGNLNSVKAFAETFLSLNKPLHILVNNAGVFNRQSERRQTSDGFELHMGTNHIGHFLLTSLLLDKLKQTGTADHKARIVVVASMLHDGASKGHRIPIADIDYDDLHLTKDGVYSGAQAYKNSKAANVMFTFKLAKLVQNDNVTVNVMCPGFIPTTNLGREAGFMTRFMLRWVLDWLLKPVFNVTRSVDHGAGLIAQLASDEKHEGESGHFYSDYKVSEASPESRDENNQNKLWSVTENAIKEKLPGVNLM